MKKPDFKRYLDYSELTKVLSEMAEEKPNLAKMYSIGKTYEGRDMWLLEVTNFGKGDPRKKPGMYIDGNHHAGEVTGSMVCLYTAWYLLSNYDQDSFVKDLLDDKVFYILPRISVDGAEVFLNTPLSLRSSARPYPPRETEDGLTMEDVDGDGWILQMRVKAEDGDWKISTKDPRLMVRREPWDKEGPFYKVYPEGVIKNWDGGEIKMAPPKWGLDINRNYPANWEPEVGQRGSGPYPLSEPETRNVAEFIISHPNIGGGMSYHTTMGAILRPSCTRPDDKLPREDVNFYRVIGRKGTELTGYPCVSTFEDYTSDKSHPLKGVFMDWLYEHQGILTFSTELWDASVRAGNKLFDRQTRSGEESQLNLLKWNDRELAGQGFSPWRKFNHPQLGEVEIGGWRSKFTLTNPPPQYLEGECHKNCLFTLYHAQTLPSVHIREVMVEALSDSLYKVTATFENKGYLPTNVSQQAVMAGKAKPCTCHLETVDAKGTCEFVFGKKKQELGHIQGLGSGGRGYMGLFGGVPSSNLGRAEWVIKAAKGTRIRIQFESEKGGTVSQEKVLE